MINVNGLHCNSGLFVGFSVRDTFGVKSELRNWFVVRKLNKSVFDDVMYVVLMMEARMRVEEPSSISSIESWPGVSSY